MEKPPAVYISGQADLDCEAAYEKIAVLPRKTSLFGNRIVAGGHATQSFFEK